jgi:hypothetical protein
MSGPSARIGEQWRADRRRRTGRATRWVLPVTFDFVLGILTLRHSAEVSMRGRAAKLSESVLVSHGFTVTLNQGV